MGYQFHALLRRNYSFRGSLPAVGEAGDEAFGEPFLLHRLLGLSYRVIHSPILDCPLLAIEEKITGPGVAIPRLPHASGVDHIPVHIKGYPLSRREDVSLSVWSLFAEEHRNVSVAMETELSVEKFKGALSH
jgi:hypothetical protein